MFRLCFLELKIIHKMEDNIKDPVDDKIYDCKALKMFRLGFIELKIKHKMEEDIIDPAAGFTLLANSATCVLTFLVLFKSVNHYHGGKIL